MQYDPEGKKNRNLYYHFADEHTPDKLIADIKKGEADEVSFEVSNDYKYLLLSDSQSLCAANIESLEGEIVFKQIFKISGDVTYVSRSLQKPIYIHRIQLALITNKTIKADVLVLEEC